MSARIIRRLWDRVRLENLRIEARLRLAFVCVLLLMFTGSGIAFWYFQEIRTRVGRLSAAEGRLMDALQINNELITLMSRLHRSAESGDPVRFESEARKLLAEFRADTAGATQVLREITPENGREKLILESVASIVDSLPERVSEMIDLAYFGDWVALHARLADEVDHTDDVAEALMREANTDVIEARERLFQDIGEAERQAAEALVLFGLLGLLAAACLGLLVTRSITEPLAALAAGAQTLARGDFQARVEVKGSNELAMLADAFNQMNSNLARLYGELSQKNYALEKSNQALQRANDDLNVFAYSASHDLQEPLRNVMLCAQLFQRKYGERLDAQGEEFLGYMTEGASRMSTLLQDLLSYIEASNSRTHPAQPISPSTAIREAIATLQPVVRASGATVTYEQLPAIAVEPVQLQQLFQNLIGNAIKYRGPEAPHVQISAEEQDGFWCFSVKDNGIGISPQYRESIFGLFKRLHCRNQYPGTGIGLALCQKIVERYGGKIWVESEPGKGSTFKFTVPKEGRS